MSGEYNPGRMHRAALAAVVAVLCVPTAWARGQHASAPAHRSAPAPAAHASAPRPQFAPPQPNRPQYQGRPAQQPQGRPQANAAPRPAPGYPTVAPRPAYPASPYQGQGYQRPAYPGNASPGNSPPGHLGDWLNQHRNLPAQEQERMLRNDPSFKRLNPADQQRVVRQLHQVNQMPEEQRQRRLARAEMIERLSPQEQLQVNFSARRLNALPADRRAVMGSAFRDLRAVPLNQRQTVLNSARYQGVFSPEERGILSDMLRIEPYEPAR